MNQYLKKEMQEFLPDFLFESCKLIENISNDLLLLKSGSGDKELLNNVFRSIHTIKGNASFFGLEKILDLTHEIENVLNLLINNQVFADAYNIQATLDSVNVLKMLIKNIENGNDMEIDTNIEVNILKEIINKSAGRSNKEVSSKGNICAAQEKNRSCKNPGESKTGTDDIKNFENKKIGEILVIKGIVTQEDIEEALEEQVKQPKLGEILLRKGKITEEQLADILKSQKKPSAKIENSIRIEVRDIDELMNKAEKLEHECRNVIELKNKLIKIINSKDIVEELCGIEKNLCLLSSGINNKLLEIRTVNIGVLFNKFKNIAEEIAQNGNKEITIEISGQDLKIDRAVFEQLNETLLHLVRNAIDHGIEEPANRQIKGKQAKGVIKLGVRKKKNSIIIEIRDDGCGIDKDKIIKKALACNLIAPGKALPASDADLYRIIFLPGFSTAEKITGLSGRGVGLDIVKTGIERMGGKITLKSNPGTGTTVILEVPFQYFRTD